MDTRSPPETGSQRLVKDTELKITTKRSGNEPEGSGLKLLTINFGTYSDQTRRTTVSERRDGVRKLIKITPKYDLIFCQEISAPKSEAKKLGLKYESRIPSKEAGLMWSNNRVALVKNVDAGMKIKAQEKVTATGIGADLNSRSAVAVYRISLPGETPYLLLAISWHGPHKNCNPDEKKGLFKDLQKYAMELKSSVEQEKDVTITIDEIIIAGDFNTNLANLNNALVEGFKITIPGFDNKKIDGYVYLSSKHVINETQELDCRGLDHKPLKAQTKQVEPDFEEEKQLECLVTAKAEE